MILITLAGAGAGAINSLVGSGTLITFPTLVAIGLSAGDRHDVQRHRTGSRRGVGYLGLSNGIRRSVAATALADSGLLGRRGDRCLPIAPPSGEGLYPDRAGALIMALILVVLGPRIQAYARQRAEATGRSAEHVSPSRMAALVAGTFAVGVYGGYFTAAQGILLIGVGGALLPEDMQRMNAAGSAVVSGECRRRRGLHGGGVQSD